MGWQDDQVVSKDWRQDAAAAPSGTPLSAESPDISATGAPPGGEDPMAVAAQIPQHINDALYKTISAPGDLLAMAGRGLGLLPKHNPQTMSGLITGAQPELAPLPSEANRGAIGRALGLDLPEINKPADTPAKKAAAMVGDTIGDVASTAVPFGYGLKVGQRAAPMLARAQAGTPILPANAGPTVGRGIAESMAANPGTQLALTGAGNAAAPEIQASDLPEFAKPYAQMAVPFALAGLGHMGQRAISAAPAADTAEAERRALLDYGQSIGGVNTAGKITDSKKMQTLESANSKLPLPFVGGRVARTEAANRDAFQAEALRKAGDTTGATAAPPSVTDALTDKLGRKFDFLTEGLDMKVGPEFSADLAKARGDISKQLESQMPPSVLKKLDELEVKAGTNDASIDGETYQNIRSKLSKMLTTTNGTDTQAVGKMIDALDNVAERNMPKDNFNDLKEARQQWRNLIAIKSAVKSANNPETAKGNIPTAAYMRASRDNPDIEKLGRYGAAMVGDKIPDSGTAQRLGVRHIAEAIGGAAMAFPHAPLMTSGAVAGATLPFVFEGGANNPISRAYLMRRLQNPSQPLIPRPMYGALAGQQMLQQGEPPPSFGVPGYTLTYKPR